jgi:hypothetical protein
MLIDSFYFPDPTNLRRGCRLHLYNDLYDEGYMIYEVRLPGQDTPYTFLVHRTDTHLVFFHHLVGYDKFNDYQYYIDQMYKVFYGESIDLGLLDISLALADGIRVYRMDVHRFISYFRNMCAGR